MTVICGEDGINVDSLANVKLTNKIGGEGIYVSYADEFTITYKKMRAKKFLTKPLGKLSINDLSKIEAEEIDSAIALKVILETTKIHRNISNLEDLLIVDMGTTHNLEQTIVPISKQARKTAWMKFIESMPSKIKDHNPTLRKLRVTGGVIEWFKTDGDVAAVSHRLGNTISTALKNYIPIPLQEAVYRKRIRRFQSILLLAASKDSDNVCEATNMTLEKVDNFLKNLLDEQKKASQHSELAKIMFGDSLKSESNGGEKSNTQLTFIVSKANIAICHALAFGIFKDTDKQLSLLSRAVIQKLASTGTRLQQRLLKQAIDLSHHIQIKNKEIYEHGSSVS